MWLRGQGGCASGRHISVQSGHPLGPTNQRRQHCGWGWTRVAACGGWLHVAAAIKPGAPWHQSGSSRGCPRWQSGSPARVMAWGTTRLSPGCRAIDWGCPRPRVVVSLPPQHALPNPLRATPGSPTWLSPQQLALASQHSTAQQPSDYSPRSTRGSCGSRAGGWGW